MVATKQSTGCSTSGHELLFVKLVTALLTSGTIPNGSVVDCGANTGGEACHYARTVPNRLVHAVEPVLVNYERIRRDYAGIANLRPLHGALSNRERFVDASPGRGQSMLKGIGMGREVASGTESSPSIFPVFLLDHLFGKGGAWAGETLALGHFDVEGDEEDLLRGAEMTIRRDRPIFTIEINRKTGPELLKRTAELDYEPYLVPERCGLNSDCRNVICLPAEARGHIMQHVPVLHDSTYAANLTNFFLPLAKQRSLARAMHPA